MYFINEYVIIDTLDKNDYENGCVYRRGFDYDASRRVDRPNKDDTETVTITQGSLTAVVNKRKYWNDTYILSGTPGAVTVDVVYGSLDKELFRDAAIAYLKAPGAGAVYEGKISGPEGGAAPVHLTDWINFNNYYDEAQEGERDDNVNLTRSNGKETDTTKAGYCILRDEYGNVEVAYLSFDFPYDVFEVRGHTVSPYGPVINEVSTLPSEGDADTYYHMDGNYYLYEDGNWIIRNPWTATTKEEDGTIVYTYDNLIHEKQESVGHPFYYSYDIKVPKGIHGKNIDSIGINRTNARLENGDVDPANHNYEWYFELRNFDENEGGIVEERYYTGNHHKVIDRITTSTDAEVVYPTLERNTIFSAGDYISFPENDNLVLYCMRGGTTAAALDLDLSTVVESYEFTDGDVLWRVVERLTVPPDIATVHYTHGDNQDFTIRLLRSLELDDNGKLYARYSDVDHRSYIGENRSIIGIGYNADPRVTRFYVKYNTYYTSPLGEIEPHSNFIYTADDKDVEVFPFTDISGREIEYIDERIKFISKIGVDPSTKRLTIYYNTGETDTLEVFRTINRLYWNDDFRLVVVYNAKDADQGLPIEQVLYDDYEMKYVEKLYISDEGNLNKEKYLQSDFIVGKNVFSDDGFKHDIKKVSVKPLNDIVSLKLIGDNLMVLYSSPAYRDSLTNSYEAEYEGQVYKWANLGSILSGNHNFGNFDTLEDLKAAYPYGFGKDTSGQTDVTTQNRMGWVATVGNTTTGIQFWAYDYTKPDSPDNWYMIQELGAEAVDPRYSIISAKADNGLPVDNLDAILNDYGIWLVVTS